MSLSLKNTAPVLLIIDVQNAIDDPSWGSDRNNPQAERNIAQVLNIWRHRGWPIIHVRHSSREAASTYRPGQPGFEFKPEVAPQAGERTLEKHTNSAFIGTSLELDLRSAGVTHVVVVGVITNNSVEATVRMSGNLGFTTIVVSDATATFGMRDFAGTWRSSAEVHAMSLANMADEYATVVSTVELMAALDR